MSFLSPAALSLLFLFPALLLVYVLVSWRRRTAARRFASRSLLRSAMGRTPGWRRHVPPLLYLVALGLMVLALSRPEAETLVPATEATVILALDISGSMSADDIQPNRLDATRAAADAFIERQPPSFEVGIVTFSDNAFVVQPPTDNKDLLHAAVKRMQIKGGTAIGRGLTAALDAIAEEQATPVPTGEVLTPPANSATPAPTALPPGQYQNAIIILMSDGENNQAPDPLEIAQIATERGIRVYTVGIGTPEGTIVRIGGRATRARLDEQTLQTIADMTGGAYYNARTAPELVQIYDNLATTLTLKSDKIEVTRYVTAAAILVALLAGLLSLWWFNRLV